MDTQKRAFLAGVKCAAKLLDQNISEADRDLLYRFWEAHQRGMTIMPTYNMGEGKATDEKGNPIENLSDFIDTQNARLAPFRKVIQELSL